MTGKLSRYADYYLRSLLELCTYSQAENKQSLSFQTKQLAQSLDNKYLGIKLVLLHFTLWLV